MARHWVGAGHIRAVTPGKRVVRIVADRGCEDYFTEVARIKVQLPDGETLLCRVAEVRVVSRGDVLVTFVAGVTRDNVARMKNAAVSVELSDAQEQATAGLALDALIGFAVQDEGGNRLGTVVEVYDNGIHGVIEMETDTGLQMFPLIEQTFAVLQPESGILTVKDLSSYLVGSDLGEPGESDAH